MLEILLVVKEVGVTILEGELIKMADFEGKSGCTKQETACILIYIGDLIFWV